LTRAHDLRHASSELSRLSAVLVLFAAACTDPLDGLIIVGEDPSDNPIAGIDGAWMVRFDLGDAAFEAPFRESQGLGPLYIRHACTSCHVDDARGPGMVRKMAILEAGVLSPDQSALAFGPTVRPLLAAGATQPIMPPDGADVWITERFGPAVFGRGYLEAIEDAEIERMEAEQASGEDGVTGRVHRVSFASEANPDQPFHSHARGDAGLIGRFGLKARLATLDDFAADAYQGDMGITSPLRPDELPNPDGLTDDALAGADIDLETLNLAADYVRLLAIPRRGEAPPSSLALFDEVGCARCHAPSLHTRADYPIAELADIDAPVYTDLLLHDMGEGLADGQRDGDATPREWRTAPLMGLRHLRFYLHDARAATIEEAILMHASEGSEANASIARFEALSEDDRAELIGFVESL
jgi:CxxC motif-containing protein (DUF1111 family)